MTLYYREGYRPPPAAAPITATVIPTAVVDRGSAALAWLTCAGLYALYKAAGGPLPWWPAWVALGLFVVSLAVELRLRSLR